MEAIIVKYYTKNDINFCYNPIIEIYNNYDIIISGDNMETKNIKTLDELFKNWKEAHINESEKSCESTFPLNRNGQSPEFPKFKESFCTDGYITDASNYNGVLIVCRESNVSRNEIMGEYKDFFAMKDSENNMTVYYDFIKKVLNKLNMNCSDKNAKKCAYMNLNKRGGYGSTNSKRLANYVVEYKEFIEREIEILKPEIIICGGTYGTVKELELPEAIKIYDCYHPAYKKCFKMDK